MIKIKVSSLSNGRYDFDFEGNVSDLDIPEPYTGKFNSNIVLDKFEDQIILNAETGISANLICDRCAREFQSIIKSHFKLVYLFRIASSDDETDREEVIYLHPENDKIELDKDVRDYAILAIPMKNLCSADCKGLCTRCGKNLNDGPCNCTEITVNPIWEPLQKLKTKNN